MIAGPTIDKIVIVVVWLYMIFSLFFNHSFISFFLPWTFRESLRPAFL